MDQPAPTQAVDAYLERALKGYRGVMARLARAAGAQVPASTLSGWRHEPEHIPAWFLFAVHRATGLSLDEAAAGKIQRDQLERRVRRLEVIQANLVAWLIDRYPDFIDELQRLAGEPEEQTGA